MRSRFTPGATAIAVSLLLSACGGGNGGNASSGEASFLLAVVLESEREKDLVQRAEVHVFIPGGLRNGENVAVPRTGGFIMGAPTRAVAEAKDVDGDGVTDVAIDFLANPFAGREVLMRLEGNVNRPLRIRARTLDDRGPLAEGEATQDEQKREITFAPGPEPVVEIRLKCVRAAGCTDDGRTDGGSRD